MTEKELLASIRAAARELGWHDYHTFNSYRSSKGFPDLILARGLHLVVAELKSEKGKVTPEQEMWLDWWRTFGDAIIGRPRVDVFVWRPADLDEAYRFLASGRAP